MSSSCNFDESVTLKARWQDKKTGHFVTLTSVMLWTNYRNPVDVTYAPTILIGKLSFSIHWDACHLNHKDAERMMRLYRSVIGLAEELEEEFGGEYRTGDAK